MKYIKEFSYCRKCEDMFYNLADIESIRATRYCGYCFKEIKLKKDLVELEKKRKKLEDRKLGKLKGL